MTDLKNDKDSVGQGSPDGKDSQDSQGNNSDRLRLRDLAAVSSIGVNLGVSVIIGLAIGSYLDKTFETKPLFTVVFIIVGFAAGILNAYRVIKRYGFDK